MTQLRQLSLTHYTVCIIFFVDSFFSQVRALLASGRSCDLNSLCSKMDWILNRTTSSFRPLPSSMNSRTSFTSPTVGTRRPSPPFVQRPREPSSLRLGKTPNSELRTPGSISRSMQQIKEAIAEATQAAERPVSARNRDAWIAWVHRRKRTRRDHGSRARPRSVRVGDGWIRLSETVS